MENDARSAYCLVLPWSFDLSGGVNEVVKNLALELSRQALWKPLAMELPWSRSVASDVLPATGTTRLYAKLRPPYIADKALLSAIAFLLRAPGELFALRRLVKQYNIKIFNLHFPDLIGMNFVLLRLLGLFSGEVLFSFHGSDIRAAYQEKGLPRALWKFMLRHASAAVGCSEGLTEEIRRFESRARTITIHNGIDIARFSANAGSGFEWPDVLLGKRILVNVSSFEYRKGQDVLVRAFHQITVRYPDVNLALVGVPGPASAAVRELIAELRLTDRVHILERVPHARIYDLLTHSELFVLATRWRKGSIGEGFAISVLEAAAAKLPVVATASCGVAELIQDGETGRVVELENATALAGAISDMLDNPAAARRMAEQLYSIVSDRFTWSEAADRYLALCARTGHDGSAPSAT